MCLVQIFSNFQLIGIKAKFVLMALGVKLAF